MATRSLLPFQIPKPYLLNILASTSLVPILSGACCILNPSLGLTALQFPQLDTSLNPKDRRISYGLMRMYGVRQMFMGICTLAMWWTGSERALGLSTLGGMIVAATDGVVAFQVTGKHVVGHWVGLGMSLVFGGGLLGLI